MWRYFLKKSIGWQEGVRWDREKKRWYTQSKETFTHGLMSKVHFDCSTEGACLVKNKGTAVGQLTVHVSEFPQDCVRSVIVKYNKDRNIFYDDSQQQVDRADYLLLKEDGTAVAGWKA